MGVPQGSSPRGRGPQSDPLHVSVLHSTVVRTESRERFAALWGPIGFPLTPPGTPGQGRRRSRVRRGGVLVAARGQGRGTGVQGRSPTPQEKRALRSATLLLSLNWEGSELQGPGGLPGQAPPVLSGNGSLGFLALPPAQPCGSEPLYGPPIAVCPADPADDTLSPQPV